jgi:restriction system protein
MVRRRSLFSEIYAERKKAQHEQQQQRKRDEKAAEAARKQEEKSALTRERAAEKAARGAEQDELRQAEAAVRALKQYEAEQLREQRRQAAEAVQRRVTEAEAMTRAAEVRVGKLERILSDRSRHFATARPYLEGMFDRDGAEEFVAVVRQGLGTSNYPEGFQGSSAALYRSEARELLVEYELPRQTVIPAEAAFRYVKSRDVIQAEPRKSAEVKKLYADLLARVTLRTVAEAFDITPPTLVDGIVFNGYVAAMDRATGRPIRALLISTHATRDAFSEIRLDEPELDPVLCLRGYLNAVVSPHPYDLEPVRPVVQFDLSKYKFVEEMQVAAGLDSRPDLLALKPVEFEHLVRELFEAIGMKSWVTQASRDDGVDGVATQRRPGGGWPVHHSGQAVQQDRRSGSRPRARWHHGRQTRRQRRPRHHLRGRQGKQRLRRPQRANRDHRRTPAQIHAAGTPRPRRPHQPVHPATQLAQRRHFLTAQATADRTLDADTLT